MDRLPLLVLPPPAQPVKRGRKFGGSESHAIPSKARQAERLSPAFTALTAALAARAAELRTDTSGVVPEEVLVLETVGAVEDFVAAVRPLKGLEWLGEVEERDIPPDEHFFRTKKSKGPGAEAEAKKGLLTGRVYLALANQQALEQLLSMWSRWKDGQPLPRGFAQWGDMFGRLRDVRRWDVRDRLLESAVLDDWELRLEAGEEEVPCEIELWFRRDTGKLEAAARRVRSLVAEAGGRVLRHTTVPQIAYSGLLARLPARAVENLRTSPDTQLVKCEQIRFFQAVGQALAVIPTGKESEPDPGGGVGAPPRGEPVAALLDGLPLEGHERLARRLRVDDPETWSEAYPVSERVHGTAMASLILHGDLGAGEAPLARPLYVRPILRPDPEDFRTPRPEAAPQDRLVVDLVHEAVRRMFEGPEGPAAPEVRIVNLSFGDLSRPFDSALSPLARLLDWLAWKYQLLFLVSAGNHFQDVQLDLTRKAVDSREQPAIQNELLRAVAADVRNRRLLSPAEAINVLSVGSMHRDASDGVVRVSSCFDPYVTGLPSPFNAQGMGFRRGIKPDVFLPGGRVVVSEALGRTSPQGTRIELRGTRLTPGQLTAVPGKKPGELGRVAASRGTSNATALATRAAVQLYDVLEELREQPGGGLIDQVPTAVWLKALLAHGADWGDSGDVLDRVLRSPENSRRFREYATRLIGYGEVATDRLGACTEHRVTVLGGGKLAVDQAHEHLIPMPPGLSGKAIWRRLTVTLAWLTPVNPFHQGWRSASLWFTPPSKTTVPNVKLQQADSKACERGTLQHEVLEGEKASAFTDGTDLKIQVNCRADAGSLDEEIPYALVVSLEVAEKGAVPIYQEVRQRILPRVRVRPSSA